jgi:hypothetical protein
VTSEENKNFPQLSEPNKNFFSHKKKNHQRDIIRRTKEHVFCFQQKKKTHRDIRNKGKLS